MDAILGELLPHLARTLTQPLWLAEVRSATDGNQNATADQNAAVDQHGRSTNLHAAAGAADILIEEALPNSLRGTLVGSELDD